MVDGTLSVRRVAAEDWPSLSSRFEDLTYEQSLTYAQAAARRIGATAEFLSLHDAQGAPVAAACLRIKRVPVLSRGIAWIAAGPLIHPKGRGTPDAAMVRAILSDLRRHVHDSGHVLRLRFPIMATPTDDAITGAGFVPTEQASSYRTVLIDPDQDDDTLMRTLHGKWRNPLRNALKTGMELETGPIAELSGRFHKLFEQVQAAKGFQPDIPPEFYYPLAGPDFEHDVLIALKDGADIGTMTIGRTGTNAVYLFGATSEAGRKLNAGHYLMWQAILHCREHRIRCFDLGGIDQDANPSVTRFKLRTGGTDTTAAGPFEAWPADPMANLIGLAEALHGRLKR
ncbi:peptidoglycan bridge formation glycyltransferase FemA/FemB family protein [Ruegeria sp. 6PALISEP08]|uniref:lipid II:glycine glycyltransferase FemX n=1 Tax=Ruegeria sp. 6PALISEP08 TaxID=1225660 RepID=UPI00067F5DDB|nr:peptidoglycan bridge formation glycyltransferase FemA/FemB family protein [Ruegeria sp. 6PALISEP08]